MPSPNALASALQNLVRGESLSEEQSRQAVETIMTGEADPVHVGAFLTALSLKGASTDELVGAARAMQSRVIRVEHDLPVVLDTCGTGGDGCQTFNISTATAFVVAAAGIPVAKHGNRAVSSSVGSADVLEALGVRIDLPAERVSEAIRTIGIGFIFAPLHHNALRHAAAVRRTLGFRTIFNLLGPATNPAAATHQLIGIFDPDRVMQIAEVLKRLGLRRALVVHGPNGMDEIGLSGPTQGALLDQGEIRPLVIDPADHGFTSAPVSALQGGDAATNAEIIRALFTRDTGPPRDIVMINAGAALWVAGRTPDLSSGIQLARAVLDAGLALKTLDALRQFS